MRHLYHFLLAIWQLLAINLTIISASSIQTKIPQRIPNSPATTQRKNQLPVSSALSIPQRLIAGGTSRCIAQMVLYPIDALRTLAQTRDGRTLADVGLKALVRGCTTTSSFALLMGSIQFAIFGALRQSPLLGPVGAAALGAVGSCVVSVPQEVIKQRLVTGVYSSFREACGSIWKTEGVLGFYSAWKPTMARNVPFVMTTFTAMDYLKRRRLERCNRDDLTVVENLTIGISSALIAAVITNPADVIKTRMMTQAASTAVPYTSTLDCISTILRTEGVMTFYSGFLQRTMYMGPLWALQFALNGKFSKTFGERNARKLEEQRFDD